MSKLGSLLKIALAFIVVILLIGLIVLRLKSPGTIKPITDEKGNLIAKSICEHKVLSIGGFKQHLTLRGVDSTKQVIFFLHGGPGNPIVDGLDNPKLNLEHEFVVAKWEQFGSGRSYAKSIKAEDMKIDSLVSYATEISNYLRKRFKQEKIHVIGHSWGTQLGMFLINQHPELFHSYIGIAQTTDVYEAERIAFDWVKKKAASLNDKKGIKELSKIKFPGSILDLPEWNDSFGWTHRTYVNKYEGVNYGEERPMVGALLSSLFHTSEYTIKEKRNYIRGLQFSLDATWRERLERSLQNEIDSIQIPVIIVHGLEDYNIPHVQAKAYFDELKAPYKKFYTFEKSAHYPYSEEVGKFNQVIIEEILDKY